MADWTQATGFEWDNGNSCKSEKKHDVSQPEAEQVFFNEPLLVFEDSKHNQKESRYHALGVTDDKRLLHITFTLRVLGTLIRIISARGMHKKERKIYEQSKTDT